MSTHFFGIKDWTFSYSHSVGRNEFAGTGFRNPVDLALAPNDVVYVVNRSYENRPDGIHITVCTLNEEYIREFGEYGEGDGQFIWPSSIALDAQGNVYISDEWLNRISIFDKDGKFLGKWGKAGSGDGELQPAIRAGDQLTGRFWCPIPATIAFRSSRWTGNTWASSGASAMGLAS